MAERRMFSKSIIDSDLFLDMPQSAQCLYFHLAMRADDEGFVDAPKKIQRMIGASEDDCRLLIAKKFLIPFETGVVVIRHWRIHNYIQKDRFKGTMYQQERSLLSQDSNGAYQLLDTGCTQDVSKLDTQVRLGKYRLDKGRKDQSISASLDDRFDRFWKLYPVKKAKQAALKAWKKINPDETLLQTILSAVEAQKKWDSWTKENGKYIPYPATWLNQGRWEDEDATEKGPHDDGPERLITLADIPRP